MQGHDELTIVAVADDDQIMSLPTGVLRCVVVTWERAVFQVISKMCISSYCKMVNEGHCDGESRYRLRNELCRDHLPFALDLLGLSQPVSPMMITGIVGWTLT